MSRLIRVVCLISLFFTVFAISSAFARTDLPLSARECKMLLKADRFTDRTRGFQAFWNLVKQVAAGQNIGIKEADGACSLESARIIRFFDTPDHRLYKLSLILRQRHDAEIKRSGRFEKDGKVFELALKYRHPDPDVAIAQDCRPADGYDGKISFEEDVVAKADSIDHLFSLNGKIPEVKEIGSRLSDWYNYYPGLKRLKLDGDLEIRQVNDVTIHEVTVEPGKLDFGKDVRAKVSLAVWYREGQAGPLIAEFSYKYKLVPGDSLNSGIYRSARLSDDFLEALRTKARDWIAVGQTKTGLVYNLSAPHQE